MKKISVWFLSAHDQPRGQSSRNYDFARELVKRGHRVTMFCNSYCHWTYRERLKPGEKWRIEEIDGIQVGWLKTIHYKDNGLKRGLNMLSNARRCFQASSALQDDPDVVIGPSVPLGTGWAAARIAEKRNAAFVFDVRDVWPICLVLDGGISRYGPVYSAFRVLEKYLYRKSQRIASTLPFLSGHVEESGGDPSKIEWIPNGLSLDKFPAVELEWNKKNRPIVVMYLGGYGDAHDVINLLKAASILQDKGNGNFRFVLYGNGINRLACEAYASSKSLRNLEFLDPIPKVDVPKTLVEADILVACVKNSEAYKFGMDLNKLGEYMASGRPVIFSGVAPNDLIKESGGGFSIPPERPSVMAESLERLQVMTPTERTEIGKRGRVYIEQNYDMTSMVDRMESMLWKAILEKKFNA